MYQALQHTALEGSGQCGEREEVQGVGDADGIEGCEGSLVGRCGEPEGAA